MIKFTITDETGTKAERLYIGLSFANLEKLLAEPRSNYIKIDGRSLGVDCEILIFSGETEEKMGEMIEGAIGPDTRVSISKRLKS